MSSIFDTLKHFNKIDREISVISNLVVLLVGSILLRIAWLIYQSEFEFIWSSIAVLGALMSALLISKSASRLILHNQIFKENEQRMEVVRLTHHALSVLSNLIDLVKYLRHYLDTADKPSSSFIGITKDIEDKWSLFYDRDLYQLLTPEASILVRSMSGSFFGLVSLGRALEIGLSQEALMQPLPKSQVSDSLTDNLRELETQLDELYTELEKIRNNVQ